MITDIDTIRAYAREAALKAGECLRGASSVDMHNIGKDIKLDKDRESHTIILEILKQSTIPILSEEDDVHNFNLEHAWVVDPLDGSINYFRGIPNTAVSVALVEKGKPVLGVVYDFNREELYEGSVGSKTLCNGKEVTVSRINTVEKGVLMTGFPSYTNYETEALLGYIARVQNFKKVRLIGSAALSLAYVASGKADAYFEKDIKIWDVAAGLALIEASGGAYTLSEIGSNGACTVSAGNGLFPLIS